MPGLPLAALFPRAEKRVIHSSMGPGSRDPYVRPYFHMGNTLLFPWLVFSLCQPGSDAWSSLRQEERSARDWFGYWTALGVLWGHITTAFGWECPPIEGVMAPLVCVLSFPWPCQLYLCTA